MSMPRLAGLLLTACVFGALAMPVDADTPDLGTPLSPQEVRTWDRNVFPDGRGLPKGRGTAREGRAIFEAKCQSCHGPKGRGHTAEELAGSTTALSSATPDKTIGTYWPFATTLFDFTLRAMPMDAPGSLTADETYAVTAYLLFLNGIVPEEPELTEQTLPLVKMPNRDGFDRIDAR